MNEITVNNGRKTRLAEGSETEERRGKGWRIEWSWMMVSERTG